MQILDLLGMYFDAVVAEVKTCLLLFRLALAILWLVWQEAETDGELKKGGPPLTIKLHYIFGFAQ